MQRLVVFVSMVLISGSVMAIGSPPAGAAFPGANGYAADPAGAERRARGGTMRPGGHPGIFVRMR
jgi:hypothetical protein